MAGASFRGLGGGRSHKGLQYPPGTALCSKGWLCSTSPVGLHLWSPGGRWQVPGPGAVTLWLSGRATLVARADLPSLSAVVGKYLYLLR